MSKTSSAEAFFPCYKLTLFTFLNILIYNRTTSYVTNDVSTDFEVLTTELMLSSTKCLRGDNLLDIDQVL